jgi:hypothetical protein
MDMAPPIGKVDRVRGQQSGGKVSGIFPKHPGWNGGLWGTGVEARDSFKETTMAGRLHESAKEVKKRKDRDANRDPLTGTAGAHPIGVGVGAVAGAAAAGAAVGTMAGPAGTLVGAAVGAVAGAAMGKAAAEAIDPTVEDAYWKQHYAREPYYEQGRTYKDYAEAYRIGYEGRMRYERPRTFEEVEADMEAEYNKRRLQDAMSWQQSRAPARAAWDRVERIIPAEQGSANPLEKAE